MPAGPAADKGPRVDLTMVGDWGTANFHTLLGWLSAHLRWRSAPLSQFTVKTGSAYRDGIEQVGNGLADLAITTPSHIGVGWASRGLHFYGARAFPNLRTLGHFPQDDRLTFAVRADVGVRSFAEIREKKPALHIATPARDHDNLCSYVIDLMLQAHGIAPADILAWGGSFYEHENPRACLRAAVEGRVNAVFNEAIMVSNWTEWAQKFPVHFMAVTPEAMQVLTGDYGLRAAVLEAGRVHDNPQTACLDWSNWAVVVRDDMPEDLAWRITAVMVEERAEFEARFRHMPVQHSPLTYPIEPARMPQDVDIALHPGAARYYRAHGYLRDDGSQP